MKEAKSVRNLVREFNAKVGFEFFNEEPPELRAHFHGMSDEEIRSLRKKYKEFEEVINRLSHHRIGENSFAQNCYALRNGLLLAAKDRDRSVLLCPWFYEAFNSLSCYVVTKVDASSIDEAREMFVESMTKVVWAFGGFIAAAVDYVRVAYPKCEENEPALVKAFRNEFKVFFEMPNWDDKEDILAKSSEILMVKYHEGAKTPINKELCKMLRAACLVGQWPGCAITEDDFPAVIINPTADEMWTLTTGLPVPEGAEDINSEAAVERRDVEQLEQDCTDSEEYFGSDGYVRDPRATMAAWRVIRSASKLSRIVRESASYFYGDNAKRPKSPISRLLTDERCGQLSELMREFFSQAVSEDGFFEEEENKNRGQFKVCDRMMDSLAILFRTLAKIPHDEHQLDLVRAADDVESKLKSVVALRRNPDGKKRDEGREELCVAVNNMFAQIGPVAGLIFGKECECDNRCKIAESEKSQKENEEEERIITIFESANNRLSGVNKENMTKLSASAYVDMLVYTMCELLKELMSAAPFYNGKVKRVPTRLPSQYMLSDGVVLLPYAWLLNAKATVADVPEERWQEVKLVADKLFALFESIIGGYAAHESKQQFTRGIVILKQKESDTDLCSKDAILPFAIKMMRDYWYELGYELEKREQQIVENFPIGSLGIDDTREARMNMIAARNDWYAKYSPDASLRNSAVKMIQELSAHVSSDMGLESTAFHYSCGDKVFSYELELKVVLGMDVNYAYSEGSGDCSQTTDVANHWVDKVRKTFCLELKAYCKQRSERCPVGGEAIKLWTEAEAIIDGCEKRSALKEDEISAFVAKGHEAARAEWIETEMHEKEKSRIDEGVKKLLCDYILGCLEQADKALLMDINLGLYNNGPTKIKIPEEKKSKLIEDFPHQKGEFERRFKLWEERGIKRHEYVLPNNPMMSNALYPFTEEFFDYRKRAGDVILSEEYLEKLNDGRIGFVCSWQTFIDDLPNYIDDDALVTRFQDVFDNLCNLHERRILHGDEGVDVFEFRSVFATFKEKLLDISALVARKSRPQSADPDEDSLVARIAEASSKATIEGLTPRFEGLQKQGENTNRNVLRALSEGKQIRKNTVQLLKEQGVNEELTNHDNEKEYRCRYIGVDLEMLKAAGELVLKGTSRSSAAEIVFKRREFENHGFSSVKVFKTQVYRYCEGTGIAPKI